MALAFMRRHKKWLHVFLWMTIPAMIIAFVALYIPTDDARAAAARGALLAKTPAGTAATPAGASPVASTS